MAKRVLVLDDEPQIGQVLEAYLRQDSFEPVVCTSVAAALEEVRREPPDMLILDITLPDGSGLDVLRSVRAEELDIPAIMLTARADEIDRVVGLELGADDYVTKPFSPREVLARVRAVLRRSERGATQGEHASSLLRVRDLEIDRDAHSVRVSGKNVTVTPAEFRILVLLAENAGRVLSRAHMLDLLHDDGTIFERTLDRHINHLRRKIEPEASDPKYIVTVYGVGYKMDR